MILGHLPAGYLWTRRLEGWAGARGWLAIGMLASVAPDFDLLYYVTLDHRRHHHHEYWSHTPFWWLVLGAAALLLLRLAVPRRKRALWFLGVLVVVSNALLHLALDSIADSIRWLYPVSTRALSLVGAPREHELWVWNFVCHWTFAFEVLVVAWAIAEWLRARRRGERESLRQAPRLVSTKPARP